MDTTFWDNLGKPTVRIDEFYENEACDEGIARLLEGRERQEEFTFQDILEGHNNADDIRWFIMSIIDNDFRIDYKQTTILTLKYVVENESQLLVGIWADRAKSCLENYSKDGEVSVRCRLVAKHALARSGDYPDKEYVSGAHKLLNYINNNWTRK
ncbi:MAG: hypothetical protein ACRC9Y_07325 [Aeromonas veronii]